MDPIIDFPHDVFLLVIANLSPRTIVLCRRVCRRWNAVLTDQSFNLHLLKVRFPRCREMRMHMSSSTTTTTNTNATQDWTALFAAEARRYHHLRTATPRSIETMKMINVPYIFQSVRTTGNAFRASSFGTLSLDTKSLPWCYDDGFLVYPGDQGWVLLDLEHPHNEPVPIRLASSEAVVRRVRLHEKVLLFEWRKEAEAQGHEDPDHDHFVTVFDIITTDQTTAATTITHRATWELRVPGNHRTFEIDDRFLSTHTKTHYAVYIWQARGRFQNVLVWDMSPQLPRIIRHIKLSELDFYGISQQEQDIQRIRELAFDERGDLFFVEEAYAWMFGAGLDEPPRVHRLRSTGIPVIPTTTTTTTTGAILQEEEGGEQLVVQGPAWLDECGANWDVDLSFCSRPRTSQAFSHTAASRWPGWAPCWRHEKFPYITVGEMVDFNAGVRITARHCFVYGDLGLYAQSCLCVQGLGVKDGGRGEDGGGVMDVTEFDAAAALDRALEQFKETETAKSKQGPCIEDDDEEVEFPDETLRELAWKNTICGDERWLVGQDEQHNIVVARF